MIFVGQVMVAGGKELVAAPALHSFITRRIPDREFPWEYTREERREMERRREGSLLRCNFPIMPLPHAYD